MKYCRKCEKSLDDSLFSKRSSRKSGKQSRCKNCCNKATAEWKAKNKEQQKEYRKKYHEKNKDHRNIQTKKYYQNNKSLVLLNASKYKKRDNNLYSVFCGMKRRCESPTRKFYKDYGGRGISVEWKSYHEFKKDMYESYLRHLSEFGKRNTTIERLDVNGNYCKNNCCWATFSQQAKNKRNTRIVVS
jgi:hypothetical protein